MLSSFHFHESVKLILNLIVPDLSTIFSADFTFSANYNFIIIRMMNEMEIPLNYYEYLTKNNELMSSPIYQNLKIWIYDNSLIYFWCIKEENIEFIKFIFPFPYNQIQFDFISIITTKAPCSTLLFCIYCLCSTWKWCGTLWCHLM